MPKTQRPAEPPAPKRATTAVVLCPGPSLSQTWQGGDYRHVIGVNRAVALTACSYWTFLDPEIVTGNDKFAPTVPIGCPHIFTGKNAVASLQREGFKDTLAAHNVLLIEDIWNDYPQCGWTIYSAASALVLAAHLKAEVIDVYGADWKVDGADYDGVQTSTNRGEARWESERQIWEELVKHFKTQGISVQRILP